MNKPDEAVVLVVDEDEVARKAVVWVLQGAEFPVHVLEASTADEAILQATHSKLDCIVLDHGLPTAPGEEFLSLLRNKGIRAPVVVLTGLGDEKTIVMLMKAGVRDYLSKDDFAPEHLVRSVSHAIRLHRAEDASRRADARWRRYVAMHAQLAVVSPKLFSALTEEALLESAANSIRELFEAQRAFLVLCPAEGKKQRFALAGSFDGGTASEADLSLGEDFWDSLQQTQDTLCLAAPDHGKTPMLRLVAPIRKLDRSIVGAVAIDRYVGEEWEGQDADRAVLLLFSHMVSVAIENARLFFSERNAVRAREEILAIVSHDLRTPLGSVQLAGSLIRELVPSKKELELVLDRMDGGVAHMQQLIEDLLDLARIDSGTLHIEAGPTPVGHVVELATSLMESAIARRNITLKQEISDGLPRVIADSKRVVQLLTNLLGNAANHAPRGGKVTLRVHVEKDEVVFAVEDNGEGFTEEELTQLFERFWQAKRQSKRGLGLGLYIAKAIVDAHGGRIWAEGRRAPGTCFTFTLPAVTKDQTSRGRRA